MVPLSTSTPGIEKLNVDNYATWRTKMKFLLITRGLWGAVSGESATPDTDSVALALIGLYVMDHHLPVLERCATAKEAWDQLEATFQAKSNARKRQLRKELSLLRMGPMEPLTMYVARAKELQNQLRAAGHAIPDQEVAWAVLAGLPSAYDTVVTVLETSSTADIALDDVLPKLLPVEQRMAQESKSNARGRPEAALSAHRGGGAPRGFDGASRLPETRTCYSCGKSGHIARNCPNRRNGYRPVQQYVAL